jgi:serine/threonine-protein kinase
MSTIVREGAQLRSDRYEFERQIGRGAAAVVWRARDTLLERAVAVKVLSEALVEDEAWLARFQREARIAAGLHHPNLVPVYDLDAESEPPYIVMAYVPGGSLQNRLDAGGCPDPERIARDILSALEDIHSAGIVHRDIKPANVLFERDGRACLTDFGIARPDDAISITQTGQMPGTARYMAPELWRGDPATPQSDLYSLGVMLGECLREPGSSGSPKLSALITRLRSEQPANRPGSADAALAELRTERALVDPIPPPTQPTAIAPAQTPNHGRRLALLALLALVVVTGIVLASSLGGDDPASRESARAQGQQSDGGGGANDAEQPPAASDGGAADGSSEPEPTDPVALNDQGYALMQEGQFDEAIPLLQQAVAGLEGGGEITYAYALFNLGSALRQAGRSEEAIPILEARLQIPNQTETVAAELELARQAAGIETDGEKVKPEKPGKAKGHDKRD